MGSNLGIADIQSVAEANRLSDDLGIDSISAGNSIAWAMEAYEKGILTKEDVNGLDLKFGNVEATFSAIKMIAYREGKLGALLAQGVKHAPPSRLARAARSLPSMSKAWNNLVMPRTMPPLCCWRT